MLSYRFFDYKDNIPRDQINDSFGTAHIVFMILAIVAITLLCIFLRKSSKKSVGTYLKVISIIVPIIETTKIVWESVWDISFGKGFNWGGLLPLYTCSLFIYTLPFAAWTKGKVQKCALGFLTTISIFAGLTNFFIPPILGYYPFFTFATFVSLYFHTLMVFTGFYIVTTGYYVPKYKDAISTWLPVAAFSVIVIPVNFILRNLGHYPDYMLYMSGSGAPVLPDIANFFNQHGLTIIYSLIIMIAYIIFSYLFISIYHFARFKEK